MSSELVEMSYDNLDIFKKHKRKHNKKFCEVFETLIKVVAKIHSIIEEVDGFAGAYDFDKLTPGNGYRSFVKVFDSAVNYTLNVSAEIKRNRKSIFFRKKFYEKEITACRDLLHGLCIIGNSLIETHKSSTNTSLFSEHGVYDNIIRKTMKSVNLECFQGRLSQFHFPASIKVVVKGLAVIMATCSDYYFSVENTLIKILRLPYALLKYLFDSELLSQRLVTIHKHAEMGFGKFVCAIIESKPYTIWQEMTEHRIAVDYFFEIAPDRLKIHSEKSGKLVDIPVPSSHIGIHPVPCRLLSNQYRIGMVVSKSRPGAKAKSSSLIIHCHGGGWVSQSPRSHGTYLREWAETLDIPILSIDYSLAPEAPFPCAVEDTFFAYCWALNNLELLGTTGENILLVGDSAGANLVTACVTKSIEMGIRKPKALFNIYGAFMLDHTVAPSRFLGLIEVILPYNVYMRCVNAYNGNVPKNDLTRNREIPDCPPNEFKKPFPQDYLMTPILAPDGILSKFPRTYILTTEFDSCLDECVEFAKRLRSVDVRVQVEVLEQLPHGFLNFSHVSNECHEGSKVCMQRVTELLESDE